MGDSMASKSKKNANLPQLRAEQFVVFFILIYDVHTHLNRTLGACHNHTLGAITLTPPLRLPRCF